MNITLSDIISLLPVIITTSGVLGAAILVYRTNRDKNKIEGADSTTKAAESLRDDLLALIDAQEKRINSQEERTEKLNGMITTLQNTINTLWGQNEELRKENSTVRLRVQELELEKQKSDFRIKELEEIVNQFQRKVIYDPKKEGGNTNV